MFLRKQSWVSAFKNSMTVMICKQDKILVESDTTSQHINYKHCNTMLMQCMLLQMYINSNKSGSLKLRKHTSGWIQHAVTTRRDIWRQWWAVHEDNYSNVTTLHCSLEHYLSMMLTRPQAKRPRADKAKVTTARPQPHVHCQCYLN